MIGKSDELECIIILIELVKFVLIWFVSVVKPTNTKKKGINHKK